MGVKVFSGFQTTALLSLLNPRLGLAQIPLPGPHDVEVVPPVGWNVMASLTQLHFTASVCLRKERPCFSRPELDAGAVGYVHHGQEDVAPLKVWKAWSM